jgi:aliphatic nitrilase
MSDAFPRFTVAAVQAASVLFDRDKTIDRAIRLIEEAADKGAVIIAFPEVFVAGHMGVWYKGRKLNPFDRVHEVLKEIYQSGVKVPSPATDRLCKAAKKANAYVVIGINEIDPVFPGTLYMSQLFISDSGEILGVHRKMMATVYEKFVYSPGDGSYLRVFDSRYGKLSGLTCGEHNHSLFKYALVAMGAQIHIAGWPPFPERIFNDIQREATNYRLRQFAKEGQLFVLNCCGITDEQNIEACFDMQEDKDAVVANTGGGTSIIDPAGSYLAGPVHEGEAVLTAEISLEDAFFGKTQFNVLGDYGRWDVVSLNFNREKLSPFKNIAASEEHSMITQVELQETNRMLSELNQKLDLLTKSLQKKGK